MKFRRKQLVHHVKVGGTYRIVHTPDTCRLEATNEPAYAYRAVEVATSRGTIADLREAPLWVRGQAEMEDGRFVEVAGAAAGHWAAMFQAAGLPPPK